MELCCVVILKTGWLIPGQDGSKCPYPQVGPRWFCSPSPTALCLWMDPRSAAAGRPVPPSTDKQTHEPGKHQQDLNGSDTTYGGDGDGSRSKHRSKVSSHNNVWGSNLVVQANKRH